MAKQGDDDDDDVADTNHGHVELPFDIAMLSTEWLPFRDFKILNDVSEEEFKGNCLRLVDANIHGGIVLLVGGWQYCHWCPSW